MAKNTLARLTDEELMARFTRTGSRSFFELLYRRYFSSLCKYLFWLCGDESLAKEIAQETLISAYEKPGRFDPGKVFKTWIFVVAKNRLHNRRRDERTRVAYQRVGARFREAENGGKAFAPDTGKLRMVSRAMKHLSEKHREVVALKYADNLTIAEISKVLGCSQGTVKSRLFHALKQLKTNIIHES